MLYLLVVDLPKADEGDPVFPSPCSGNALMRVKALLREMDESWDAETRSGAAKYAAAPPSLTEVYDSTLLTPSAPAI
jgi:hypothetical protein